MHSSVVSLVEKPLGRVPPGHGLNSSVNFVGSTRVSALSTAYNGTWRWLRLVSPRLAAVTCTKYGVTFFLCSAFTSQPSNDSANDVLSKRVTAMSSTPTRFCRGCQAISAGCPTPRSVPGSVSSTPSGTGR